MSLLSEELNWKKKLFDEGFLNKNLFLAEKMIYQVQTNALQQSKAKSSLNNQILPTVQSIHKASYSKSLIPFKSKRTCEPH